MLHSQKRAERNRSGKEVRFNSPRNSSDIKFVSASSSMQPSSSVASTRRTPKPNDSVMFSESSWSVEGGVFDSIVSELRTVQNEDPPLETLQEHDVPVPFPNGEVKNTSSAFDEENAATDATASFVNTLKDGSRKVGKGMLKMLSDIPSTD